MSQVQIDDAEWENPANWHAGFYYSRRDSRSFVPKRRQAMGATINFARLAGYLYLLGIFGFVGLMYWLRR